MLLTCSADSGAKGSRISTATTIAMIASRCRRDPGEVTVSCSRQPILSMYPTRVLQSCVALLPDMLCRSLQATKIAILRLAGALTLPSASPLDWQALAHPNVLLGVALADEHKEAEGQRQRRRQEAQAQANIHKEGRGRNRAPPKRRLRTERTKGSPSATPCTHNRPSQHAVLCELAPAC